MKEDAEETTDREIEFYLKKLEWADIKIDRQRYNDFQRTSAAESDA